MKTEEITLDENSTLEDFRNLQIDDYVREGFRHGEIVDIEIMPDHTNGEKYDVVVYLQSSEKIVRTFSR